MKAVLAIVLAILAATVGLLAAPQPARADVGPPTTQTVLVLRGPAALAGEEQRLVEALRIYTRDRDCRLVVEGEAPETLEGRAVAEVVARARRGGAALAVWVGRRADGRVVYDVLSAADGDLRETEIAPLGPERTAVEVALKVRALLARPLPRVAEKAALADAGAPAAAASPAPPPPPLAARPSPPEPAPSPTMVVARAAPPANDEPPPPPERFALGVAYGVFLPTDPTWVRQGLVVSLEARVGHLAGAPLSLAADAGFVNTPQHTVHGVDVTLADTPLGLSALVRGRWGRVGAACGPRVGLHVLDVAADAGPGRTGASRRLAAGLGGRVEAELRLFAYMKVYLGATFEGLVPKQEFTIGGQSALDTGSLLVAGTAGVALLIL